MLRDLLACRDQSPRRDVVLLNAAVALATDDGDIQTGLELARESLESGAALVKLDALVAYSQSLAGPIASVAQ
jgi:anthranilate phosphoribosyltransferase